MIKNSQEIKGISINEFLDVLLGQYADDADVYSVFDQEPFNGIMEVIQHFKRTSGFTLN